MADLDWLHFAAAKIDMENVEEKYFNMENPNGSRGRTPKKDSDSNLLMHELIRIVAEVYHNTDEIKATATELSLPPNKVKKLLITGKVLSYPETEQIQALLQQGKTMEEIQAITGLSHSAINTYLPYSK